jgi:hypothetical protein
MIFVEVENRGRFRLAVYPRHLRDGTSTVGDDEVVNPTPGRRVIHTIVEIPEVDRRPFWRGFGYFDLVSVIGEQLGRAFVILPDAPHLRRWRVFDVELRKRAGSPVFEVPPRIVT